jgi:hypothetical protein
MNPSVGLRAAVDPTQHIGKVRISFHDAKMIAALIQHLRCMGSISHNPLYGMRLLLRKFNLDHFWMRALNA